MYEPLLDAFDTFKDEAAIIGHLLAGYGQIEIDLMYSVAVVRDDMDTTLKAMFRDRGERRRIMKAASLGRDLYEQAELGNEFDEAITAMDHCREIRNQYAHCKWYDDYSGSLAFVDLEELAQVNQLVVSIRGLTIHHVDAPLLKAQLKYFEYTSNCLVWLNFEVSLRAGKSLSNALVKPQQIKQPQLHI